MSTSNGCFPRVLEKGKGSLAALWAVRSFSIPTESLLERGMRRAVELQQGDKHPWKRSLWVVVLVLQETIPTLAGEGISGGGHLTRKPADCQSLLSKHELGLRVINHAHSDRNPGPYLYPKKCHWSLVPSSIKETDSCNKEGPYQISAREPKAASGTDVKGFYEG